MLKSSQRSCQSAPSFHVSLHSAAISECILLNSFRSHSRVHPVSMSGGIHKQYQNPPRIWTIIHSEYMSECTQSSWLNAFRIHATMHAETHLQHALRILGIMGSVSMSQSMQTTFKSAFSIHAIMQSESTPECECITMWIQPVFWHALWVQFGMSFDAFQRTWCLHFDNSFWMQSAFWVYSDMHSVMKSQIHPESFVQHFDTSSECVLPWIPNACYHGFWLHSYTPSECIQAWHMPAFWHVLWVHHSGAIWHSFCQ